MRLAVPVMICLALAALPGRGAQSYRLDPTNSLIQIRLGTAGLLAVAGHGHLIETPIREGTFVYDPSDLRQSHLELEVDARQLRVIDPGISARDRAEVQATMESDRVLGVQAYPRITFMSSSVRADGRNELTIQGMLTVRRRTMPVTIHASLTQTGPQLKATGETEFKQTDLGIKPVTAVAGTVRVRDLMKLTFRVAGHPVKNAVR